jgi:predicted kinase
VGAPRDPMPPPTPGPCRLIVLAGLPGVGKSALAAAIAGRVGAVWIRVDTIEAALLKAGLPHSYETGVAAYGAARDIASDQLRLGHAVVVDAVNAVPEPRVLWRELAAQHQVVRRVIEVVCSDPVEHRRRVETRPVPTPPLPPPTWDDVTRRPYAPWDEPVLTLDSVRPLDENVDRALRYCLEEPGP